VTTSASPWASALGARFDELDPALRAYFDTIPEGSVGRGEGVFTTVGTPRRWLWPVLAILGRAGIVFPVWERDVPFVIENRPSAHGLESIRTFRFGTGSRVMADEVRWSHGRLLQGMGSPTRLVVELEVSVSAGSLVLRSRRTALRIGRRYFWLPFAPSVRLGEHRAGERQRVSLALEAPLIGRIYEYEGEFDYRIEPE
jgi:hypothetical protein